MCVSTIAKVLVVFALGAAFASAQQGTNTPRFEDYPVKEIFKGKPAEPILTTPEQRRYRTRIREGALKGRDLWSGSSRNWIKVSGPNFAGHYFLIRWGCGSQCVMMAIIDAETGRVYGSPLSIAGSELFVPLDNLSDMEIEFRRDSSLMVLRNACRDFRNRKSCGRYYFNWSDNHFVLLKFIYVNPL